MTAPWALAKEYRDKAVRGFVGEDMQFAIERAMHSFRRWSRIPILENTGLPMTIDKRNGKTGCKARRVRWAMLPVGKALTRLC